MRISQMQRIVFQMAVEKGFHTNEPEFGTRVALIHSELSEALEEHRVGNNKGVAEELADAVMRIGDLCALLGVDLESEIRKKIKTNQGRPWLHGKEYG